MAQTILFESDDDCGPDDEKISINKSYAQKYQKFKECQELDKLKLKYGNGNDEESSSTSESEDEDAVALTPQIEADFMKTLSMIKNKDPKIYEKDSVFFSVNKEEEKNGHNNNKADKVKEEAPFYLKDYERKRLLEKGEKAYLSESDDDEDELMKVKKEPTYEEELHLVKKDLLVAAAAGDSDGEGDDLLQIRNDISEDAKRELEKEVKIEKKSAAGGNVLSRFWNNEDIDSDEKFLRDYILKKQFVDNDDASRIPSYKEVVDDSDEQLDKETEFERKFNFRFEDPDPEFIKQYPRTIKESVRKKDDRRKQHRKEREERKNKEKEKKKEELKRLKNLKRKEIMEKIEQLKELTGNDKIGFLEEDLQDDFDNSRYDQIMEQVFDDNYYDAAQEEDEEKPVFSDDGILENEAPPYNEEEGYDEEGGYDAQGDYDDAEVHCEDPDFIMDADYDPQSVSNNQKKKSKKWGWNAKFKEALEREKPHFDPSEKTFEEYFDEYYKLDFEDIIDDIPVRFKYREVAPNDFGLSVDEILKAEDKELNEWCSLKKTTQYFTEDEERKLQQKYKKKAKDRKRKLNVFPSLEEEEESQKETESTKNPNLQSLKKTRSIKLLQKKKRSLVPSWNSQQRRTILSTVNRTKMKQIRNQFKGGDTKTVNKLSLQRLAAYGLAETKNS